MFQIPAGMILQQDEIAQAAQCNAFIALCQGAHLGVRLICSRLSMSATYNKMVKKDAGWADILKAGIPGVVKEIVGDRTQTRGSLANDWMSIQPPSASSAQLLR